MKPLESRRRLLQAAGVTALAHATRMGAINAWAQTGSSSDFKALVCVFLVGGNDGANTVVPLDDREYARYRESRPSIALPKDKVLPIETPDGGRFGLHPSLSAIHGLWEERKAAVVANVGNLIENVDRERYLKESPAVPSNLFSHSDQVSQLQSIGADQDSGWAGRIADELRDLNSGARFPVSISMAGPQIFCRGRIVQSASLIPGASLQIKGIDTLRLPAVTRAYQAILRTDTGLILIQAANKVREEAFELNAILSSLPPDLLRVKFPYSSLGKQLEQVARVLAAREKIGARRQLFYCELAGFDTHGGQSYQQGDLLRQLSEAIHAFYLQTAEFGLADSVTIFLESEFGRTMVANGNGTDHGWGSHLLVVGGGVRGAAMYGRFPSMRVGGDEYITERGVWIPTTSMDQYGATLASWFGVPDSALGNVFPNLGNFGQRNLGFLSS